MALRRKSSKPDTAVAVTPTPSAGVFLGTLRSEFDEPAALPATFSQALARVEAIIDAYRTGELGEQETAERLAGHTLTDATGAQWTVGATTRRWYRRMPGGSWLPTPPPAAGADDLSTVPDLDESLLATMSAPRVANPLDLPSELYATVTQDPPPAGAAEPASVVATSSAAAATITPAADANDDLPAPSPSQDLLSSSRAANPQPARQPDDSGHVVWSSVPDALETATQTPAVRAESLSDVLRATLSLELPAPDDRAIPFVGQDADATDAGPVAPARHGVSLSDLLSVAEDDPGATAGGYGVDARAAAPGYEEPVGYDQPVTHHESAAETIDDQGAEHADATAHPEPAAAGGTDSEVAAMLAELLNTAPVLHDGEEVEEIPLRGAGDDTP